MTESGVNGQWDLPGGGAWSCPAQVVIQDAARGGHDDHSSDKRARRQRDTHYEHEPRCLNGLPPQENDPNRCRGHPGGNGGHAGSHGPPERLHQPNGSWQRPLNRGHH